MIPSTSTKSAVADSATSLPVSLPLVAAPGMQVAEETSGSLPVAAVAELAPAESGYSTPAAEAAPAIERRKMPRFPCEGSAEVIVLGGALRFTGQVRDLSGSGCCLSTQVMFRLERGTQVEVVMMVNNISFRVMGGVRSNHKVRGVGLEFMNVSSRCARYIRELIAELEAKAAREREKAATAT